MYKLQGQAFRPVPRRSGGRVGPRQRRTGDDTRLLQRVLAGQHRVRHDAGEGQVQVKRESAVVGTDRVHVVGQAFRRLQACPTHGYS